MIIDILGTAERAMKDYALRCVVCRAAIDRFEDIVYANAWEATLGERPCCSEECKAAFRADVHWLPAERPFASSEEAAKLVRLAVERMRRGDDPVVVVRELLCAGVPASSARHALRMLDVVAAQARPGWLARLLTPRIVQALAPAAPDRVEVAEAHARAEAVIVEWERRFGSE